MLSLVIGIIAWINIFVMLWFMIMRVISRNDLFTWGLLILCLVLALLSGVVYQSNKEKK